ncbi:hypothetical protein IE81DRAFT_142428 [Ceraceosorus guamensis]|uniref:Uncharacterized protein n=1 Tax=Ceraceosorus guamensis TaxID=1522189 RepID=A0A316W0N4_9BASI|nr:hypothetical protein IE81DRAFT_142428 [Ceraceosorus guamensis]PWN42101.1 hypothetical protein IE81DRAFT_142428 [Ceraceosorus guamensis]
MSGEQAKQVRCRIASFFSTKYAKVMCCTGLAVTLYLRVPAGLRPTRATDDVMAKCCLPCATSRARTRRAWRFYLDHSRSLYFGMNVGMTCSSSWLEPPRCVLIKLMHIGTNSEWRKWQGRDSIIDRLEDVRTPL